MDGTLITSFPPKRAPRVPPGMTTHIVGIGSKVIVCLNGKCACVWGGR